MSTDLYISKEMAVTVYAGPGGATRIQLTVGLDTSGFALTSIGPYDMRALVARWHAYEQEHPNMIGECPLQAPDGRCCGLAMDHEGPHRWENCPAERYGHQCKLRELHDGPHQVDMEWS